MPKEKTHLKHHLAKPDYYLIIITFALLFIGVIMVFSSSPTMGLKIGDSYFYLKRQLFNIFIGMSMMLFAYKINYKELNRFAVPLSVFGIFLLIASFFPALGREAGGATRWIDLGLISFQPSELMKFSIILLAASILSSEKQKLSSFIYLFGITALSCFLILKQPDLGTVFIISMIVFLMLFLSSINLRYLFSVFFLTLASFLIAALTSPYRFKRLLAFINPWKDPENVGFHIIQSLLAVGSGGLFGLGLGASKQKFFYLPSQYTDFIFAILCEEFGLIGGMLVVILFIFFLLRGVRISLLTADRFGSLLAYGLTFWIALQALTNISVVIGILPTTGIPLPFISFGGTSIIIMLFSVGILLNISKALR